MKGVMPAPTVSELWASLSDKFPNLLLRLQQGDVTLAPRGRYYHWDNLRQLKPPHGLSAEEWWLGVKLARRSLLRPIPLTNADGEPFVCGTPDEVQELLHHITQHSSGEIKMPDVVENEAARRHFLVNSLIEEAIRSSQLEGASTTHQVAKEMIRSGRPPRDRSERMIVNNYRAMEYIREELGDRLTPEAVLDLHRVVTEGTLGNPDAAGRLQRPDEERVVVGDIHDPSIVHHVPPPAEQLEERLELMCRFANGEEESGGFIHPVVRAILIHFWMGHDHPFEDGNGRTARALFYWSMRTQGYWLTEYLSISRILRQGPSKYTRAYLHSESDEGDTTYFVIYQLHVIRRAVEELHKYLERKMEEAREIEFLIRGTDEFNHRQLALLSDAVRKPNPRYTFRSHSRSHRVTFQTGRTDLLALRNKGLLQQRRVGRQYVFTPVPDLVGVLSKRGQKDH